MKWIFRLCGLLVVLAGLLVAAVFLMPTERVARVATEQLSAATGRDVSIGGDVALTFWPVLGVSVEDLEIGNAPWAASVPMFQTTSAAIGVNALGLLRGDIEITHLEARSPTIRLTQMLDGRANWQFSDVSDTPVTPSEATPSTADPKPEAASRTLTIARLDVTDAQLIYDAEGSDVMAFSGVDLALDWPDPDGAASIVLNAQPGDAPISLKMTVDTFNAFIAGSVSPLSASLQTASGDVSLDGRASTTGAVAGRFAFTTPDTDSFLRALGLPAVGLQPKMGRSIDLSTDMTLTPDLQLALRGLRADLGGNVLTGAVDLSLDGTPRINAQLEAGALDLVTETGASTGGGGSGNGQPTAAQDDGWSTAPIDASGLAAFDGDIALSADSIDLGTFKLGQTRTVLRNENARMVFELRELAAYGGNVTGDVVINNRNGLSVGGKMTVSGIEMQPLLKDAVDVDRLTGQGDLQMSFLGAGQNLDAIMRSLSGDGSLAIGSGTIEGINLDQLLRGGASSGTTIFDDLTASWTIASGVLSNRDLLFQLKNYSASGEGVVGLGAQTIDYRFTPVALRSNSGEGLAIPVEIKGPWSNVSIRPDVEAALDLQLDEERRALEDRAKEELTDKLGVRAKDGQSTEDAVKDQLLRKLFD